ncbi:MAG: cupin domain-containing protein [Candidatus Tectimicrobiota bacterium]
MRRFRVLPWASAIALLVFPSLFAARLSAQAPGFKITPLLQSTFGDDASKEAVVLTVDLAPGSSTGRHTHPGDCYGTVVDGVVELHVEGREARWVSAGEAYHNPRGIIHAFRNMGEKPVRLVNTMVVDKGKPRLQPVPQ